MRPCSTCSPGTVPAPERCSSTRVDHLVSTREGNTYQTTFEESCLQDCLLCGVGTIDSGEGKCVSCPSGSTSSADATVCGDCQPGSYVDGNMCVSCPVGHFAPLPRATACEACLPGEMPLRGRLTRGQGLTLSSLSLSCQAPTPARRVLWTASPAPATACRPT
jgi:hypothetical protein